MSIHVLPDEILLHICDQVSRGLFNLLRVCRRWNKLFSSRAWRSVDVADSPEQIIRLLTALQENPDIGPLIQHLKLHFSVWHEEYWEEDNLPDIKRFQPLVEQASHSSKHSENWINDLKSGITDAWVALLVPALEGVKSLELDFSSNSDYFLPMVARAAARECPFDSKPVFQNLENVVIKMEDNVKSSYDMGDLLPFFCFPAIQSFSGHSIVEMSGTGYYKQYPQLSLMSSGLKKLNLGLQGPCNGSHGFANAIKLCKGLEIFEYQHDDKVVWGDCYIPFIPRAFYISLFTQKDSLREIRLNNRGEHPWHEEVDDPEEFLVGPFGSMTEFHHLRELQIPWGTLLQVDEDEQPTVRLSDVLPQNLEYLSLADCREDDFQVIVENLQDLLLFRQTRFPKLKILQVQPYTLEHIPGTDYYHSDSWKVPEPTRDAFASLEISCRETGIQFRFSNDIIGHYY